jgi:hypothetical protein
MYKYPTIAREVRQKAPYGFANLYPDTTGLPMTIWVSPRGTAGHQAKIRVNTTPGNQTSISNTAVIAVRPALAPPSAARSDTEVGPHVLSGRLSPADRQPVLEWVWLNSDALIAYWEGQIDTARLVQRLKPWPGL